MKSFPPNKTATDLGLQVGDKFRVVDASSLGYIRKDEIVTFINDDNTPCPKFMNLNGENHFIDWCRLVPLTSSWQHLRVGDILVNEDGDESKVLAVLGDVLLRSNTDNFDITFGWYTITESKRNGWKLKDAQEDDITELTLDQVAKLARVDVEKLRIKDAS